MSEQARPLIYRVDDIEIDTVRACVARDGQEVPLKPKAFRVLVHLLDNRHRLVTKQELLDLFWTGTAVTDDAVNQCIARLRRALGDDPRQPAYLRTVPRMGYRFVGPVREIAAETESAAEEGTAAEPGFDPEAVADSPESRVLAPPLRWWVRGALTLTLLGAAAFLTGIYRNVGLPAAQANRIVPHEPTWGEVAWWKLNEGNGSHIGDSIHGLNATLPAGVSWTDGTSGRALSFNGHEVVVQGRDPGFLPKGNTAQTLSVWIKTSTTNGDSTNIFGFGDPTPDSRDGFSLQLHEGGTAGFAHDHFVLIGKRRIDDDRWHQITGVFESGASRRMRLFVDGTEQASSGSMPEPLSTRKESRWALGRGFRAGTGFRGAIDDVRVYERALRADEILSLHQCVAAGMAAASDINIKTGRSYYFAPVFGDHIEFLPQAAGAAFKNIGTDFAGAMFVEREPDCALGSIHGADIGQDLNLEAEVRVPAGPSGPVTDGGPYFRSRRASPGDGLTGGTSAGVWVRLDSTGQVRVQRLHPMAVLGFSKPPTRFDPGVFHKVQVAVHGETLEVALDDRPLTFDVAGETQEVLKIPPVWETASPRGHNDGNAGVAFGCRNRGQGSAQEARNIRVIPYHPLRGH